MQKFFKPKYKFLERRLNKYKMSYLKQIECPDHPEAALIDDHRAGDMVRKFIIFTYLYFYTQHIIFFSVFSIFVIFHKFVFQVYPFYAVSV